MTFVVIAENGIDFCGTIQFEYSTISKELYDTHSTQVSAINFSGCENIFGLPESNSISAAWFPPTYANITHPSHSLQYAVLGLQRTNAL